MPRNYVPKDTFNTDARFEKWWWSSVHERCSHCRLTCKQSSRIKLIRCPQFVSDQETKPTKTARPAGARKEQAGLDADLVSSRLDKSLAGETFGSPRSARYIDAPPEADKATHRE